MMIQRQPRFGHAHFQTTSGVCQSTASKTIVMSLRSDHPYTSRSSLLALPRSSTIHLSDIGHFLTFRPKKVVRFGASWCVPKNLNCLITLCLSPFGAWCTAHHAPLQFDAPVVHSGASRTNAPSCNVIAPLRNSQQLPTS